MTYQIYLTLQKGELFHRFFDESLLKTLEQCGELRCNPSKHVMSEEEVIREMANVDIGVVMPWEGAPVFSSQVLQKLKRLKMLVCIGGSVSRFVTEAVYERGIVVCSANQVMARYVAEGTLAYMLAGLREIAKRDQEMRKGIWDSSQRETLIGKRVGLVGLGTVGRHLLDFLRPFEVEIRIYDPYLSEDTLSGWNNIRLTGLDEVLQTSEIISIHASLTPETRGMLSRSRLALISDGVLLINTARGGLVDEVALQEELRRGRLRAVLDVFEKDGPLLEESPFRTLQNVTLMPHAAGNIDLKSLTRSMIEEVGRFTRGEALRYTIPVEQCRRMTLT